VKTMTLCDLGFAICSVTFCRSPPCKLVARGCRDEERGVASALQSKLYLSKEDLQICGEP
jgi:hypothetical protein